MNHSVSCDLHVSFRLINVSKMQTLTNSIMRTDLDLRRNLYSNIVLAGGSTLFPGNVARRDGWFICV